MSPLEDHLQWLGLHKETILDPERPIVDPHHHLWPGESHYLLEDLWLDTHGGHNVKKTVYIDDYAHHPEEIKSTISSVIESFPDRKLTVIFQPHLFSRTKDFAKEFAPVSYTHQTLPTILLV